ncbi:hypothetical protein GCM10027614_80440 [Micromonospora vulcania]
MGGYLMRLLGGVGVIVGILGIFASLSQPNVVGVVLGVLFVAGGVVLLKRSGGGSRAGGVTSTPHSTR